MPAKFSRYLSFCSLSATRTEQYNPVDKMIPKDIDTENTYFMILSCVSLSIFPSEVNLLRTISAIRMYIVGMMNEIIDTIFSLPLL